jgi:hypothetical protein
MGNRYLAVVTVARFLAVEQYRESHQAASAHPRQNPEPGGRNPATRSRADGTSGVARVSR